MRKTTVSVLTFTELQFVKDGGFTGGIKTNHKDSHLLLAELHCKESIKDTKAEGKDMRFSI